MEALIPAAVVVAAAADAAAAVADACDAAAAVSQGTTIAAKVAASDAGDKALKRDAAKAVSWAVVIPNNADVTTVAVGAAAVTLI